MASECPYEGCSYPDDHRPYARKRDGIPSVTEVASMLDLGRARSFAWAAASIAATEAVHHTERWFYLSGDRCTHEPTGFCTACRYLRSTFDREWGYKRDLGTHIHHLALQWAKGESCEEDEVTKPYLDGLELFYEENNPEWLHLESTCAGSFDNHLHYRGSFDAIARTQLFGTVLLDIKTGGLHPQEQTLQLAGYTSADWLTEWRDGKQFEVEPMPKLDAAGCLFLPGDGDYRIVWLPVNDTSVAAFHALLGLRLWSKGMDVWHKAYKELLKADEVV